jgi:hypothetical protein
MRSPMPWLAGVLVVGIIALATWSLTRGQAPTGSPAPIRPPVAPKTPAAAEAPAPSATDAAPEPTTTQPTAEKASENPATPSPLQQQIQLSAHRGADWLFRMNGADGRFSPGQLPALNIEMEGDHLLRQASAAVALARAARFTGDERYADRATQAILVLLGETVVDARDKTVRYTGLPSAMLNRVGAAGLLVLAVQELPSPKKDLLDQAEQLCNFVRRQQRADGSVCLTDAPDEARSADEDGSPFPAIAVYGLLRSQQRRPAGWKTDVARKALAYYCPLWKEHKNVAAVGWQSAALAEAYLLTKEEAFAKCAFALNDWLCGLQYARLDQLDPRHADWWGGFTESQNGKVTTSAPTVEGAICAEALAEACRVAKQAGDLQRQKRYREALELSLQFLARLQYTQANTNHFADWYRPRVLGGFHASAVDGDLRLEYTQHVVCAMVQYATCVAK